MPVTHGVSCRQHQHRCPDAPPAELTARLEAVDPGQHDVEHDRVVLRGGRHPERVFSAAGDVGRMPFLSQPSGKQRSELRLVLDDEHAHIPIVRAAREPTMNCRSSKVHFRLLH